MLRLGFRLLGPPGLLVMAFRCRRRRRRGRRGWGRGHAVARSVPPEEHEVSRCVVGQGGSFPRPRRQGSRDPVPRGAVPGPGVVEEHAFCAFTAEEDELVKMTVERHRCCRPGVGHRPVDGWFCPGQSVPDPGLVGELPGVEPAAEQHDRLVGRVVRCDGSVEGGRSIGRGEARPGQPGERVRPRCACLLDRRRHRAPG
jgi:hypothetical protein